MMGCRYCLEALENPRTDKFMSSCNSCWARSLATTDEHTDSVKTGAPSKLYADVLRTIFGMVGATAGWQAVKDWGARIAEHDAKLS